MRSLKKLNNASSISRYNKAKTPLIYINQSGFFILARTEVYFSRTDSLIYADDM
jgi:hypothetical protein